MDAVRRDGPIGFFDSGVGGISVLRETVRLLPHEDFIYFGDDANAPYGRRSEREILDLSMAAGDFLSGHSVKTIVVACNTATSIAIRSLRAKYRIPVISIEPAVKPAVEAYPEGGTVAVFATPATLRQRRYRALVHRLGAEHRVRDVACAELAGLIETRSPEDPAVRAYIRDRVDELHASRDVCALVMGCTHYSFVSEIFAEEAKERLTGACEVFDGAGGTARQTVRVLNVRDLRTARRGKGQVTFFSSDGPGAEERMKALFERDSAGTAPGSMSRTYKAELR